MVLQARDHDALTSVHGVRTSRGRRLFSVATHSVWQKTIPSEARAATA